MGNQNNTVKPLKQKPATTEVLKSEDFRRGNLVEFKGCVYPITSITEPYLTVRTLEGNRVLSWTHIKPVKISKNWVSWCGLDKKTGIHNITASGLFYVIETHLGYCVMMGIMPVRNFKYVHELQNIWHSLTTIELKFTGQTHPKK